MMNDRSAERAAPDAERSPTMTEPRSEGALSTADIAGGPRDVVGDAGSGAAERAEASAETRATTSAATTAETARPDATPLFPSDAAEDFRSRWGDIQTGFVDDPRHAVEQADGLVAAVMKRLAESFAGERSSLEQQWDSGDSVDTENLRVALQRYRSFFDRLLSM